MGRPIYKWMIVYNSGHTVICTGETPTDALYDIGEMEYHVVAIIRLEY